MSAADGTRHVPLGDGLRTLTIRVRDEDVVFVRGIFAGYDGVASVHGDESGLVALVATESTFAELEAIVAELPAGVVIERVR
ncbi:MAG: DUF4911 domain-containing protein [Sandaracinus sp.]